MAWKNNNARGTTTDWRKLRRIILIRDNYTCRLCGKEGNNVDHITPHHLGGSNHPTNLATLCLSCHKKKTASEASEARYGVNKRRRDVPVNEINSGNVIPLGGRD